MATSTAAAVIPVNPIATRQPNAFPPLPKATSDFAS